jgi:hypothetical protein
MGILRFGITKLLGTMREHKRGERENGDFARVGTLPKKPRAAYSLT